MAHRARETHKVHTQGPEGATQKPVTDSVVTLTVMIVAAGVAQLMQLAASSSCQYCSCRREDVNVLKVAAAYCHYRGYLTLLEMFSGLSTAEKHTKTMTRKHPQHKLLGCLVGWLNLEDVKP